MLSDDVPKLIKHNMRLAVASPSVSKVSSVLKCANQNDCLATVYLCD